MTTSAELKQNDNLFIHPWDDMVKIGDHQRTLLNKGEGVYVTDSEGNRLLDAPAGMWCVNIGHGREEMAQTIYDQIMALTYVSPWSMTTGPAAEFAAKLDWSQRVELSTPVNGVIRKVTADIGDRIAVETILLSLDERPFRAALAKAQAKLVSSTALRDEAQRELERSKELYERTILSDHDLQLARIGYKNALANYQAALKDLKAAKLDLEYSSVRAPFNAVVIGRNANVGQTVSSSLQPPMLFVVAESDRMLARTAIKQSEISDLQSTKDFSILIGKTRRKGRLLHVGYEPLAMNSAGDSYEAVFIFPTNGSEFCKGQNAIIELP